MQVKQTVDLKCQTERWQRFFFFSSPIESKGNSDCCQGEEDVCVCMCALRIKATYAPRKASLKLYRRALWSERLAHLHLLVDVVTGCWWCSALVFLWKHKERKENVLSLGVSPMPCLTPWHPSFSLFYFFSCTKSFDTTCWYTPTVVTPNVSFLLVLNNCSFGNWKLPFSVLNSIIKRN